MSTVSPRSSNEGSLPSDWTSSPGSTSRSTKKEMGGHRVNAQVSSGSSSTLSQTLLTGRATTPQRSPSLAGKVTIGARDNIVSCFNELGRMMRMGVMNSEQATNIRNLIGSSDVKLKLTEVKDKINHAITELKDLAPELKARLESYWKELVNQQRLAEARPQSRPRTQERPARAPPPIPARARASQERPTRELPDIPTKPGVTYGREGQVIKFASNDLLSILMFQNLINEDQREALFNDLTENIDPSQEFSADEIKLSLMTSCFKLGIDFEPIEKSSIFSASEEPISEELSSSQESASPIEESSIPTEEPALPKTLESLIDTIVNLEGDEIIDGVEADKLTDSFAKKFKGPEVSKSAEEIKEIFISTCRDLGIDTSKIEEFFSKS